MQDRDARTPSEGSRSEQAYRRLRDAIVAGEYTPRERLVEIEVAESLGVSRTTLRAIFARLEQEGLVELEANRGARVRRFSVEEALNVLEARAALEGAIAAKTAERATDVEIEELDALVTEMADAVEGEDLRAFSRCNTQFHQAMTAAAKNPELERLSRSLHFPLVRFQYLSLLAPGRPQVILADHRRIMERLRSRDADGAEQAARDHVNGMRSTLETNADFLRL